MKQHNINSVKITIHSVDKENVSVVINEYSNFCTVTFKIANHDIALFLNDKSELSDIMRALATPTYQVIDE